MEWRKVNEEIRLKQLRQVIVRHKRGSLSLAVHQKGGSMSFFYALALLVFVVGTAVHIWRSSDRSAAGILDGLIGWYMFSMVGLMGLFFFYGHAFNANEAAELIGWPTGNPFQFEVSLNSLGTGIAGLMCLKWRGGFRWATTIIFTIIYWGSDYGHFYQLIVNDNHHPGNAGLVLYTNIIVPAVLIFLMVAHEFAERKRAGNTI
jgi:hypothetical protein